MVTCVFSGSVCYLSLLPIGGWSPTTTTTGLGVWATVQFAVLWCTGEQKESRPSILLLRTPAKPVQENYTIATTETCSLANMALLHCVKTNEWEKAGSDHIFVPIPRCLLHNALKRRLLFPCLCLIFVWFKRPFAFPPYVKTSKPMQTSKKVRLCLRESLIPLNSNSEHLKKKNQTIYIYIDFWLVVFSD